MSGVYCNQVSEIKHRESVFREGVSLWRVAWFSIVAKTVLCDVAPERGEVFQWFVSEA